MAEAQKGHTEDDFVALFPHLCYQSLAGDDGSSESNLDVRVRAEGLQDVFTRDTHEAKPVQDYQSEVISLFTSPSTSLALCHSLGFLKPPIAEKAGSICSGLRSPESLRRTANQITLLHIPDMRSALPVDGSLLVGCLLLDDGIRLSLRWVVRGRSGPSICRPGPESVSHLHNGLLDVEHTGTSLLPAESTTTSENHGTLVGEDDLAGDLVDRLYHARHVCSFALSKPASSVSGCRPRETSSFMLTLSRTSSSLGRFTRVPEVGIGP